MMVASMRRGVAASGEDVPADLQGAAAPSLAGFDGVMGMSQAHRGR